MRKLTLPTDGTWTPGERIRYVSPAAGGRPGAICTTAPTTFKEEAAIDA